MILEMTDQGSSRHPPGTADPAAVELLRRIQTFSSVMGGKVSTKLLAVGRVEEATTTLRSTWNQFFVVFWVS